MTKQLTDFGFVNPLSNTHKLRGEQFLKKFSQKQTTKVKNMNENNKPKFTVRSGNLKATVWENEIENKETGKKSVIINVTVKKGYKDKEDNWKNTDNFNMNELPLVAKLINDTHTLLTVGDRVEE